ncbi:hypothetical protein JAAARDRAFT_458499 [Jaapia argillacea MUCL 33604]|uniref:Uncharacterized protein n=1 Tax=Jaapia argillacea MUCL 33604 TaxID=933084 RepID=A0A067QIF3_9AGAM|nr:hypothetical protein JAAARDRAFT_458499 [Jaapia argillacea MUCL 33604]
MSSSTTSSITSQQKKAVRFAATPEVRQFFISPLASFRKLPSKNAGDTSVRMPLGMIDTNVVSRAEGSVVLEGTRLDRDEERENVPEPIGSHLSSSTDTNIVYSTGNRGASLSISDNVSTTNITAPKTTPSPDALPASEGRMLNLERNMEAIAGIAWDLSQGLEGLNDAITALAETVEGFGALRESIERLESQLMARKTQGHQFDGIPPGYRFPAKNESPTGGRAVKGYHLHSLPTKTIIRKIKNRIVSLTFYPKAVTPSESGVSRVEGDIRREDAEVKEQLDGVRADVKTITKLLSDTVDVVGSLKNMLH